MTRLLACQQALLIIMLALVLACSATSSTPEQSIDPKEVILHLDYRSGGDAPLALNLTILDDGRIRFLSPRGHERWSKLDGTEQERVTDLLEDSSLAAAFVSLPVEGRPFACCDHHELGVYLDTDRPPIPLRFADDPVPGEIRKFLAFLNDLGRSHFGRSYSMPLPVDSTGR